MKLSTIQAGQANQTWTTFAVSKKNFVHIHLCEVQAIGSGVKAWVENLFAEYDVMNIIIFIRQFCTLHWTRAPLNNSKPIQTIGRIVLRRRKRNVFYSSVFAFNSLSLSLPRGLVSGFEITKNHVHSFFFYLVNSLGNFHAFIEIMKGEMGNKTVVSFRNDSLPKIDVMILLFGLCNEYRGMDSHRIHRVMSMWLSVHTLAADSLWVDNSPFTSS